jgi:hypothetical protein
MDVWIISYKKRPATRMKLPKFRFSNRGENVANYLYHAGDFASEEPLLILFLWRAILCKIISVLLGVGSSKINSLRIVQEH